MILYDYSDPYYQLLSNGGVDDWIHLDDSGQHDSHSHSLRLFLDELTS